MEERISPQLYAGIALTTLTVVCLAVIWYAIDVFLLIFAGALLAIFLHSLSNILSRKLNISNAISVSSVLLSLIGILALFVILLIPTVSDQINQLTKELPKAWNSVTQSIQSYLQAKPIASMPNMADFKNLISNKGILLKATNLFSTTFGMIGSFIVFLFIGIFLAYDPQTYKKGFLRLIPVRKRKRAEEILDKIAEALRWWIMGKLFAMALIGILTSTGLWLLGVPLAITLGLFAAILTFIPNFGPILAAIPAVLIAASQNVDTAMYVICLYIGIQTIESYLITPAIQQKAVSLPPALTISAQLLMAILVGVLGLALATPLMAALVVLIKMLYVEDVLKDNEQLN